MTDNSESPSSTDEFADFDDGNRSYSLDGPAIREIEQREPLREVMETLYSEHRYICSLLDALAEQAERLKPGKVPDFPLLLDMVDYLTHYPDQYHHPREDLLFKSMLASSKAFQPKLDRLLREHEALHHYNHELLRELTRIAAGRRADRPDLYARIERYIEGYRRHIDYENKEIFPAAKGKLSAAQLKQLAAKTRHIDDPLFGGEVQYQYRRIGRRLQTGVELAGAELVAREMSGIQALIENLTEVVDRASRLRESVSEQHRDAWREQLDTVREHLRIGEEPGAIHLPRALIDNYRRHWRQGFDEVWAILSNDAKRKPVDGEQQRHSSAGGK